MPPIIDLSDPGDQLPATVAIDAMGGDKGPAVAVPATLEYLKSHPSCSAILVGRKEALVPWTAAIDNYRSRLRVVEAKEEVAMNEPVASALRNKKGSSLHVMASLVLSNEAQAAVSAGNTGALMAISRSILKTLPGIERPAIATVLPTIRNSRVYALDLGANMDCSPYQLLQFAWMGSLLAGALEEKSRPTVGLLNVGEEESKGNEVVREAAELFKKSADLNYQGYVEGDAIYQGVVDVVVCDGFVGNVVLKSTEGFARMLANILREEFNRNLYTKICAMLATPTINAFKHRIDPRTYNGAVLLGLRGVVVKSHGSADAYSYSFAIHRALAVTRRKLVDHISERLGTPNIANTGP